MLLEILSNILDKKASSRLYFYLFYMIMLKSKRFRLRRNWMVKISIFLLPLNRINFLQHWLLSQRMAQWKSRCRTGQLALEWSCDPNWLVIKNYKQNYNKSMQNYFLIIQRIFNRLYFICSSRYYSVKFFSHK